MIRRIVTAVALGVTLAAAGPAAAQPVEIEYWQYVFDTRVKAMDELIKRFQAANPGITVKHTTFPYADYQTEGRRRDPGRPGAGRRAALLRLARRLSSTAKLLQPLPTDAFPPREIEREFFPIVRADEAWTASTTACRPRCARWRCSTTRSCSREAGLDPEQAAADARRARRGGAEARPSATPPATSQVAGIDARHGRPGPPLVARGAGAPVRRRALLATTTARSPTTARPASRRCTWYTDLQPKHKVGQVGFMDEAPGRVPRRPRGA